MQSAPFTPRAMYKTELASEYGVSYKVFTKWLRDLPDDLKKQIGAIKGRCILKVSQVNLIVKHLDPPY